MRSLGFTLIELVVFISVSALLVTGLTAAFIETLQGAAKPHEFTNAYLVAEERMELILAQRRRLGFANFTATTFDPCATTPPSQQPPCNPLPAGFNISATLQNDWNGDANYKIIILSVSGTANAELTTLVANY